jgi:peptidoglycan/LPS O-acetylase OafA/YrhL
MASEPQERRSVASTGAADYNRMPADRDHHDTATQATSGVKAYLGLWLLIAPSVLDYQDQQGFVTSHVAAGLLLLALGAYRLGKPRSAPWLSWLNAAVGLWLVVTPFVLLPSSSSTGAASWISLIIGTVVAVLGVSAAVSTHRGHTRRRHRRSAVAKRELRHCDEPC